MSGNHYSKQVQQLEALLASKLKQVTLLESEHQLLRHKETALQNAIHSIEAPLALVRESLGQHSIPAAVQQEPLGAFEPLSAVPSAVAAAAADADRISWGSSTHSQGLSSPCTSTDAPNGVERSNGSITSSVSGLTAWPYKGGQELLQRINKREEKVQRVLQQISSCNGANYQQLYTTQLLQKAIADPARMAGYLNMPKHERLNYWSEAYSKMALLLGKYDSNVSLASSGNVRAQLDWLVDELFERVTVCALLDPPPRHMSCFMINVDTQEFEPYPENFWQQVAQGMELSPQDKAGLQLVWSKFKLLMEPLTQEWDQLQQQLQQLHTQQLQRNKRFEQDIKQLPGLLHTLTVAKHSWQLQRQQKHVNKQQQVFGNQHADMSPQQQRLQQHSTHVLQQQQQQQLAMLQQQQLALQQQQEQRAALSALHDTWRQDIAPNPAAACSPDQAMSLQEAEALTDELCAQLAAEVHQEQALQQQVHVLQQQLLAGGWGSPFPATPAAAAALMPAPLQVPPSIVPVGGCSSGMLSTISPSSSTPAAAAAAAGMKSTPSPQVSGAGVWMGEGVGSHDAEQDANSGCFAVHDAPGAFTKLQEAEEVLLQDGSDQRRQLEDRIQACTNKMKVVNYCLGLQAANNLSRKQLAAMCVHSHPFVYDFVSICDALDNMGWDS